MHKRTLHLLVALIALGMGCSFATPAQAKSSKPSDKAPDRPGAATIQKAMEYIYSQQKDGLWDVPAQPPIDQGKPTGGESHPRQWTGMTALSVYSLLAAGENHQEPKLIKAVDFLKKTRTEGIYALGLREQVWSLLPQSREVREAMRDDGNAILRGLKNGLFDYGPSRTTRVDHSVSQYGVLGLWAANECGFEFSRDVAVRSQA